MRKLRSFESASLKTKTLIFFILIFSLFTFAASENKPKLIHVYVALCDNFHQGIIPVQERLGNGDDPENNLYWGALFGVKTYFKNSKDWKLLATIKNPQTEILERCLFKSFKFNAFLVADAYRGESIKQAVADFLEAAAGKTIDIIEAKVEESILHLDAGGRSGLIVYIGHNGLMDFSLDEYPYGSSDFHREALIFACASKSYFSEPLRKTGAYPLIRTTGLLAPEAYILKSAVAGWLQEKSGEDIRKLTAQTYAQYQKCSIKAAEKLFVTGWEEK
jgi:hypothetical protein